MKTVTVVPSVLESKLTGQGVRTETRMSRAELSMVKESPIPKRKIFRPRGVEKDGLKYYQEQNKIGDYLAVDPATADYYMRTGQPGMLEGRATALAGVVKSVCTTGISWEFLHKKCHRVRKADIPQVWQDALTGGVEGPDWD